MAGKYQTLFDHTLTIIDTTFFRLESLTNPPKKTKWKGSFVFRYQEKTVHQAIILKMARMITGLRSAYILHQSGMIQEQGAMQRILDEIGEDIAFLCYSIFEKETTDLHNRFLSAFFEEEFEEYKTSIESKQNRPFIPRKNIRSYISTTEENIAKRAGIKFNRSDGANLHRTLSKAYSGYVHAAAPQIMDLYGGEPPRFHIEGMLGTPRIPEYERDLWNYFYRALMNTVLVAKAFGDEDVVDYLSEKIDSFQTASSRV